MLPIQCIIYSLIYFNVNLLTYFNVSFFVCLRVCLLLLFCVMSCVSFLHVFLYVFIFFGIVTPKVGCLGVSSFFLCL